MFISKEYRGVCFSVALVWNLIRDSVHVMTRSNLGIYLSYSRSWL